MMFEVADSSRANDGALKFPPYAAAGIAEAWLVDLVIETIERYTEPRNGYYCQITIGHVGDTLASTVLSDLTIAVDAVLGLVDTP